MAAVAVVLALLPLINIAVILMTVGENNPATDEVVFIGEFLGPALDGTYQWHNYGRDTFAQHSFALPGLVYLLATYTVDLNIHAILWFGVLLATARLFLLHSAFNCYRSSHYHWWLLWPVLAAQVFSTSQISIFQFDFASIQFGLNLLGVSLGIWGLARFPGSWTGMWLMALGGVMACWSAGSGPMVWPAFLLGLVLLRFRRPAHYAAWLVAAAVGVLPYVLYLPSQRVSTLGLTPLMNYSSAVYLIGQPLAANSTPIIGWLGVGLGIGGLVLLWPQRHFPAALSRTAPALILLLYSSLVIYQIALFRNPSAPWYTFVGMSFWVGLTGLAYALLGTTVPFSSGAARAGEVILLWSGGLLGLFVAFYLTSNLAYTDKVFHVVTRAPASAVCLRHYRQAPTYCEGLVSQWPPNRFLEKMGVPLERHHLSIFAPRQRWPLQGEFVLDAVQLTETPGLPDIFWSESMTPSPTAWSEYRRLNLALYPPNAISWTVSLPANLEWATFHAAIARASNPNTSTIQLEISLQEHPLFSQHLTPDQQQWQPLQIPLNAYAGQTITLRLAAKTEPDSQGDWGLYRYPYIDLMTDPQRAVTASEPLAPANTDLSPTFHPRLTNQDFSLMTLPPEMWQVSHNLVLPKIDRLPIVMQATAPEAFLQTLPLPQLCLSDYSHIYFKAAAPLNFRPHYIRVEANYMHGASLRHKQVEIPLLFDTAPHEYTYDLKLWELEQQARLQSMRIAVEPPRLPSEVSRVEIWDMRLIHTGRPTVCTEQQVVWP